MFKKFCSIAAGVFVLTGALHAQSVTLTIDAGYLRDATGTTNEPVNGLLQLIASPSGVFPSPSGSSFVGGDNALVASFAMNNAGGTGETINTLTGILLSTANYTITSGEVLELRFYPTLAYSSTTNYYSTAPAVGTLYGQVRSSTVEFPADGNETPWVVPASGGTKDLTYITSLDGGSYPDGPNGAGFSSFAIFPVTAIPEPSTTCTMLGFGVLGLARVAIRRRSRA